ncbi:Lanosterol 14-alpha-demethylase [Dimargaris cristalligena]|uniref:Lanosterol 14-alpha-demethylase n=1 Tax=Dimargaris cristalligena TaxID=215637 RepID=A0A4P9ZLE9_9FUNG|nr:Lanosterol 14-alpha-demethylase [Dimargaris cristalligena]RKP33311.1 lanosterol 14-alpha-demethylase [Dimargaris cristalligena]|eukprot:RKP33311.1 lanosterol 14-alpha-demethylase [Dimargaris cristalligena]
MILDFLLPYLREVHTAYQAYVATTSTPVLILTAIGGLIFTALLWAQIEQRLLKDPHAPPVVPYLFPFFGSMITFGMDPLAFFRNNQARYGDCYTFLVFGRRMTACLGPEGNNFFFNAKLAHVSAEEAYKHLTVPVFGKGVVYDVDNSILMEQKRFMKNSLSNDNLRAYVPMIVDETETYIQRWAEKSGSVDVVQSVAELVTLTASRTLFGEEIRSQLDEKIADLYHDLDNGFTPLNFLFENLPLESYRKRDAAHIALKSIYLDILKNRSESSTPSQGVDIINHLMTCTYKNGQVLSHYEIASIMIALLMAGQHTSSATTAWALLYMAEQPELIDQLREEQIQVLGSLDAPLTFDAIKQMPVLDNLVTEVLRLRPPIIEIIRKVVKPVEFPGSGYVIPVGDFIMASPAITQTDPKIYRDPLRFNPARWFEDAKKESAASIGTEADDVDYGFGVLRTTSARSPYLPFGAGRHRCIGEPFAYLQVKTILATLVRHFDFKLTAKGMPAADYTKMFILPQTPAMIEYIKRQ